jgi:predicted RNA binding protein YcfA (HicA-like mRNA interferase family)
MKCSQLLKLLKKAGWYEVRQNGSHMIMEHAEKKNQIVFPNHGSAEMGKGLEMKIRKQAGLK